MAAAAARVPGVGVCSADLRYCRLLVWQDIVRVDALAVHSRLGLLAFAATVNVATAQGALNP